MIYSSVEHRIFFTAGIKKIFVRAHINLPFSLDVKSEQRLKLNQKAISRLGLACYIDGSVPSMFFLAAQFHDDFENGI